jgi:myo-inositol-1(or 4)-monophosphatase
MRTLETIRLSLRDALATASLIVKNDFHHALTHGLSSEEKESMTGLPDFVTQTDKNIEEFLKSALHETCPGVAFVGEETGGSINADGYFLVDPLDGTSNFASLRDYFGICAAYIEDGEVLCSAVAIPMQDKVITAQKQRGVFVNDKPLPALETKASPLRETQLECELTFSSPNDFQIAQAIIPYVSGLRKSGSTAVSLVHMAMGRKTVCIANHLQPYDIAAPLLIARESGCLVSDFNGNDASINTKNIIAAKPQNHAELLRLIKS